MRPVGGYRHQFDALEILIQIDLVHPRAVVIADYEALLAVQSANDRFGILTAEKHISDDEDGIAPGHSLVPAFDHRLVHLLYGVERTVTQLQYVLVSEMRIGYKKHHMYHFLKYCVDNYYIIQVISEKEKPKRSTTQDNRFGVIEEKYSFFLSLLHFHYSESLSGAAEPPFDKSVAFVFVIHFHKSVLHAF